MKRDLTDEYRENLGRDPEERFPEGTEGHKQFAYRETPEERAELEALLGAGYVDEADVLVVSPDQDSLF